MKKLFIICISLLLTLSAGAQGQGSGQPSGPRFGQQFGHQSGQRHGNRQSQTPRFSPEQFQAQLEEYITKEASLTTQEAAVFFPIYREMQEKQRAVFFRQRNLARVKPSDEQGCQKVIKERDETELEMKRIQQTYHLRFLEQLPASRVYDILQAEDRFHRTMMRNWGRGPRMQQQ